MKGMPGCTQNQLIFLLIILLIITQLIYPYDFKVSLCVLTILFISFILVHSIIEAVSMKDYSEKSDEYFQRIDLIKNEILNK